MKQEEGGLWGLEVGVNKTKGFIGVDMCQNNTKYVWEICYFGKMVIKRYAGEHINQSTVIDIYIGFYMANFKRDILFETMTLQ